MQQAGKDFLIGYTKMEIKKKIILMFLMLNIGCVMAREIIVGDPKLELRNVSAGKSINIELCITNDTDDSIIIPKIYLNLFSDKYVIGNWLLMQNKNGKSYLHSSKMINFVYKYFITGSQEDYEELKINSLILLPHETKIVRYENLKNYFWIPFWARNIYIVYQGPLGNSNKLQVNVRK